MKYDGWQRCLPTDAEALASFETLALSQKPADTPWEPVTDYSFKARKAIEGPHAQLIKDVFQPTKVLDVGCGHGHLVKMLTDLGVDCRGVDKHARPDWTVNDRIWQHDIAWDGDGPDWVRDLDREYLCADVVICREVLEHLTVLEVRRGVRNLCMLSNRFVYVTTRFHPHPTHLLDVATADDLDPTHITMLNQNFLRVLFVLEGFKRRPDLEERMDWKKLGRVLVYERAA